MPLLVLLFRGSSDFSESISAGKCPEYAAYRQKVPRFIPIRFGKKAEETCALGTEKIQCR
jgi:steroid 5-alpha reductase family enzyme